MFKLRNLKCVSLISIALSALLLFGSSFAQEPVELRYVQWGGTDEIEVFQRLVDIFNENNPDIRIVLEPIPTDYSVALRTMIAGGTPPDIALVPDGDFPAFAPLDQLVNLQEFVAASETFDPDEIWPSALDRYRWDAEARALGQGDVYALPRDIGPTVLYINVDLFREAGVPLPDPEVPLTWDEIVEIGRQLTVDNQGRHPGDEGFSPESVVTWGVGDLWFENVVYGNGGRLISESGREFVAPDDERTIEAIQWIADLTHFYQIHPTAQQTASMSTSQMFETGRVAMNTCGRWCNTNYRRVLDFEYDVIPFPVGPSGEVTTFPGEEDCDFSGWSGSVGLGIIKGSRGEQFAEQAYRFIEFIAGPEGQIEQTALGFQIPNQIEIAHTDVFLQPDQPPANAEVFIEAARCQLPGPWVQTPLYGEWFGSLWWDQVWPAVVVDDVMSAEEALSEYADEFQARLDDAWSTLDR
jgi:multiple sugar transport system substrate-binding protein